MQRLTCPLIDFGCRLESCAWWDPDNCRCAVMTLLANTEDIKALLNALIS